MEVDMNRKLTLNIEEELIKFAHEYAKHTNQSLSNIITHYLMALRNENNSEYLSEKTNSLYGIFSDFESYDKKELRKQFHEKGNN